VIKKIGLSILSLVFFVSLIEFGFRFFEGTPDTKTVTWRGQTYAVPKPKDVTRIMLVGGSAAYDTVEDYRETWPHLMKVILEEKSKKKVEVVNLAYYSETSSDELEDVYIHSEELDPDMVIVFDGFNDVYNMWHYYHHWKVIYDYRSSYINIDPTTVQKFSKFIIGKSAAYRFMFKHIEKLRTKASIYNLKRLKKNKYFIPDEPSGDEFFANTRWWSTIYNDYKDIYENNLTKIAKIIAHEDIYGIFIFQPDLSFKSLMNEPVSDKERENYLRIIGNNEKAWTEIMKIAYPTGMKIMEKVANEYGILYRNYNGMLKNGDMNPYFDGNVHFTDNGRIIIAANVANDVLNTGVLG